jgi:type IV pilus assembly protein PilB
MTMIPTPVLNGMKRPGESECDMPELVLRGLLQKRAPSPDEMGPILNSALQKIAENVLAQGAAFFLFIEGSTKLQIQNVFFSPSLHGSDEKKANLFKERAALFKGMTVPVVKTSAGMCIMKDQCISVDDRALAGDFYDPIEWAPEFVITSLVAVPVTAGTKRVACIEVIKSGGDRLSRFNESDRLYLAEAANYIGKLIHRVKHPDLVFTEIETAVCLARLAQTRLVNAAELRPDVRLSHEIGEKTLRNAFVVPMCQLSKDTIRAAVADPFDFVSLQDFEVASGMRIEEKVVALRSDIKDALNKLFPGNMHISTVAATISREYVTPVPSVEIEQAEEENENSALIVQLGNRIIEDAHHQRASDIHVEPGQGKLVVRYRIDGVCRTVLTLPAQVHRPLISRLKIMSELDIAEHRMPQDGRMSFGKFSPNTDVDVRVSVTPSKNGESIVMRILDKVKSALPLSELGFSTHNLELYSKLIQTPYGMLIHCGPTGSGKSMTLFSALNELNSPEWKILTVEDPIEYTIEGITQVQTKREIGLTFASALRCFLRQDPDIILVGEIRDEETAEIAVEAAMTGHVIFSTLHTNDAPSVIARLGELGVPPFLLTSTLVSICAQRLMRRLCKCKRSEAPTPDELKLLSCAKGSAPIDKIFHPQGCPDCNQTGYKGRIGIHELLAMNEEIKELISKRATTEQLKAAARKNGMHTLFEDAMEKVKAGISSCSEALNTVRPDD